MTGRSTWVFRWKSKDCYSKLNLSHRTEEEAYKIATERGYVPRCWYKPSTWGNHVVSFNL